MHKNYIDHHSSDGAPLFLDYGLLTAGLGHQRASRIAKRLAGRSLVLIHLVEGV
jgi:hypothetical protein